MNLAPYLRITMDRDSRGVFLDLVGLLLKCPEVIGRRSGLTGNATHERCKHLTSATFSLLRETPLTVATAVLNRVG